jgi:hypothetical protein
LGPSEDLIVGDARVAARVRGLVDRDDVEAALAELDGDHRRPHLIEE